MPRINCVGGDKLEILEEIKTIPKVYVCLGANSHLNEYTSFSKGIRLPRMVIETKDGLV